MTRPSPEPNWRPVVMAAVTARITDRLRQVDTAMSIDDVPGVIGLQATPVSFT